MTEDKLFDAEWFEKNSGSKDIVEQTPKVGLPPEAPVIDPKINLVERAVVAKKSRFRKGLGLV